MLESPLDCKEIKPVNPKGNQSLICIGRTDAEAETPILWSPDAKNWPIGKGPDAGKDWRQEEKGTTEDEIGGWHHQLNGHEFEQSLGAGDGQGGLACCGSWGHKELDMTELLNWTDSIDKPSWWKGSWKWTKLSWRDPLFFFSVNSVQSVQSLSHVQLFALPRNKIQFLSVYVYERCGPIFLF